MTLALPVLLLVLFCSPETVHAFRTITVQTIDPLPSWNDTVAKTRILTFIKQASDPAHPGFIPKNERIAAIDLDGTLIVEKPLSVQVEVALDLLRRQVRDDRSLRDQQPWKAARENDLEYIRENLNEVLLKAVEGMSLAEYRKYAALVLRNNRHPRFDLPYKSTVYKPMLELIQTLHEAGFRVYLVGGAQTEFIRALAAEKIDSIEPYEVIGSRVAIEFDPGEGNPRFKQNGYFLEPDNWLNGKAENIRELLGMGPVIVAGNSMGDLEMLTYADSNSRPHLCLVINHDDENREYAYPDKELLDLAKKEGWTVVSIKGDWSKLFEK